jgi:hypothetical protein
MVPYEQTSGCTVFVLVIVLAFLGEGVTRLTDRMFALRQVIRSWAVGLGIVTAIFSFFVIFAPRNATSPDGVLSSIFQSGLSGVCAGLVWYLVVAVLTFGYQYILAPPFRFLGYLFKGSGESHARHWDDEMNQRHRQDAERAAAQTAATKADAQKRRADARAACELLYHRHAHVLGNRFPKASLDDFLTKYMGDNHSPEEVEVRGRQLQDIIREHAHGIEPPKTPYTIESLAEWYKKQKEVVEKLAVDDRQKQAQLAQLNARYAELMQSLMETLQP